MTILAYDQIYRRAYERLVREGWYQQEAALAAKQEADEIQDYWSGLGVVV
jgi:hypothetical protein